MLTIKSCILLLGALGAVSAKKQCTPKPPTTEPAPTEPVPTEPEPPVDMPPPAGGGESAPAEGEYKQTHHAVGDGHYDFWNWWGHDDPTHGRVQYVDFDTSRNLNLTGSEGEKFIIRTDTTQGVLDPNGPGRRAVRLESKEAFSYFTAILDVEHMPEGMGTWPAYWTCGDQWPNGGELDIIEGVNNGERNLMSLHTSEGCTQPDDRDMTGEKGYFDCNANGAHGNQGCNVVDYDTSSFGPNFNAAGGGWYVVERTSTYIKVWFWKRNDPNVPAEVKSNTGAVSPSGWGRPVAHFVNQSCDLASKFGPNKFIINTTFCGDWGGNAYNGGMGACIDFVNNNPAEFEKAYWSINRMTIYQQ